MAEKESGVFLKQWKDQQRQLLKANFPDRSEEEIEAFLEEEINANLKNPEGILSNNYVKKSIKVDLLGLIDWIEKVKPIIAGNGTFFKNQNQGANPSANMLDEFLDNRKRYKGLLKVYDPSSYEYATADRMQKSEKVNANSFYGGNGNEAFVFFNLYCAVSITATAQSLISTTETAFENFLANNTPYINLDDCVNFLRNVSTEKHEYDASFLPNIPIEKVHERIINNFRDNDGNKHSEVVMNILKTFDQETLNRIYFKNNIYEFCLVPKIYNKMVESFTILKDFKNPNKVPEDALPGLENIWGYIEEFVVYKHFTFNRIQRLKYEKRKAVIVVDTDSNMIHLAPWVKFITDKFYLRDNDIIEGKSEEDLLYISINVMNYFVTQMVNAILAKYTKRSNILKQYRHRINMKNEFLYLRMVLSKVKKRYAGSIRLREGEELIPEKLDIKGHDFMKASCTQYVKEYMQDIVKDEILYAKDISLPRILRKISDLEDIIFDSLHKGEKNYFLPRQVKAMEEYKEPMSIQQFKATMHWNLIYPNMGIELPSNVYVIKLRLGKKNALEELQAKYPDIYRKINKNIINSGIKGLGSVETIAIPSNLKDIPQWIIDFIDYETMVNDNVSKFYPVLEALGIPTIKAKSSVTFFSNILDI